MATPKRTNSYNTAIGELFSTLRRNRAKANQLDFSKDDLTRVIQSLVARKKLPRPIKNIPDIKYTYDARHDFPPVISETGFWAIIGRGKGLYSFIRVAQNNLIRLPGDWPQKMRIVRVKDGTPRPVAGVIGNDEQAVLTRLRYSDAMTRITGLDSFQVQSHHRTTISSGQVEIDEVYVAEDGKSHEGFVLPMSGKGGEDYLSYSQALNLNLYAKEKYPELSYRSLGVCKPSGDTIYVVEFSNEKDIRNIRILDVIALTLT